MANIGTTYQYNNQSTASAATARKIQILSKTNPDLGKSVTEFLKSGQDIKGFDKYLRNRLQTLFSQELKLAKSTDKAVKTTTGAIKEGEEAIVETLGNASKKIKETFKPVSTQLGSTLGTLTQVMKDPLGAPEFLGRTMSDVVKKVNPDFANRMDATFKKYKMDNLSHTPDQVMGSIKNLVTAFDDIISVPLSIVSDLYFGLMDIMKELSSAVDQIMSAVTNFFFGPGGILDSILPLGQIQEFLDALDSLAGSAVGISQTFSGANQIAGSALQLQSLTNGLGGFIQNPLNLAFAYAPPEISQGLYAIQNPQSIVNQYLPPQLSQSLAKISQITGFGFNGNMGYGLQSVLEGLQGGVINSILTNFASQYAILTPLLNLGSGIAGTPPNKSYPAALQPAVTNPAIKVAQGIPQPQTPPPPVVPTK